MVEHILKASLERSYIVNIIYDNRGEITQRNIRVHSIQNGTVMAFCFLRNQNRIFKIENILSAEFVRNKQFKMVK